MSRVFDNIDQSFLPGAETNSRSLGKVRSSSRGAYSPIGRSVLTCSCSANSHLIARGARPVGGNSSFTHCDDHVLDLRSWKDRACHYGLGPQAPPTRYSSAQYPLRRPTGYTVFWLRLVDFTTVVAGANAALPVANAAMFVRDVCICPTRKRRQIPTRQGHLSQNCPRPLSFVA